MRVMSGLGLAVVSLGLGLMLVACSREPRFTSPRLGEVVSIQPIAVNRVLATTAPQNMPLKLNIMWGGRMLTTEKGDTTLNFYNRSGLMLYSKRWSQLVSAYRDTNCSNEAIATLDGSLMGSALVCDGSLNLEGVASIEGVDAKGEKRKATSWSVYMLNDHVAAVSIGLY